MKLAPGKQFLVDCISGLLKVVGKTFCKKSIDDSKIIFEKLQNILSEPKKYGLTKKDEFTIIDIIDLKTKEKW
jgi:hypothetical protein